MLGSSLSFIQATFESQMSALGLESSAASSMPPLPEGTALGDTTIMVITSHLLAIIMNPVQCTLGLS